MARSKCGLGWVSGVVLLAAALLACKGGKSKTEVYAALDKHRLEYGKCEIMAESKTEVEGKPAWMAATVCRAKHRQTVLAELGEQKKFDDIFEEWKKEKGPQAVEDARKSPDSTSSSESSSSGDCPNGAGCLNRCRQECETKHGKMLDLDKMRECSQSGGGAECVGKATNEPARKCFLECRGLPAN